MFVVACQQNGTQRERLYSEPEETDNEFIKFSHTQRQNNSVQFPNLTPIFMNGTGLDNE